MHHLLHALELQGPKNKRQAAFFLQTLCGELCNIPTVRNTHMHFFFFFTEDEPEKSEAWGRWMSLNVWVKLMDCFLLLCPWPPLLLHSSRPKTPSSPCSSPSSSPDIYSAPLSQSFSVYFLSLFSCFWAWGHRRTTRGSIWQQDRCTGTRGWQTGFCTSLLL